MGLRLKDLLKRLFDLLVASIALLVLSPLLLAISLGVWLLIGRPILFRQPRPGFQGKIFVMLKFRTMLETYDETGALLPDHRRLTTFGRFLRRTSLDELPELWNVLMGDMSIVGPRPLLVEYLPRYSAHQARRHEVKPGITGWAQIHGRNFITHEQKFEYDVWYVDHFSLTLDLWILFRTIGLVIRQEGVTAPGHVTSPPFTDEQAPDDQALGDSNP